MSNHKKMTPEKDKQAIDMYLSGKGSDTIGKYFDISAGSVLKILKKHNIPRRPIERKKIRIEDEASIVTLYQEGYSAQDIAEYFGVTNAMILRYLEKNGVERRSAEECHRIYAIHEDFFDVIDTQEKAYTLGFLYADGGNQVDYNFVQIDLARKDRDILEKIAALIYVDNPKDHVKDSVRKKEYKGETKELLGSYLAIRSKHICHKLQELGCGPRKSLTLTFPTWLTDPELQRHFIRGYYDGDGGMFLPQTKGSWATSAIVSTLEFCTDMRSVIQIQTGLTFTAPNHPNKKMEDKNVYRIGLGGNRQIATFLDWLYKDSTIHLDRKHSLYLRLLEKNKETDRLIAAGTQGYSEH